MNAHFLKQINLVWQGKITFLQKRLILLILIIPINQGCKQEGVTPKIEFDNGCDDRSDPIIWEFSWVPVENATEYVLYVKHADASQPLIFETVNQPYYRFEEYEYIPDQNRYNWHWKFKPANSMEWVDENAFTVEPVNTDCP